MIPALLLILVPSAFAVEATVEVGTIEVAESAADTVTQAETALRAGKFEEAAALYESLAEAGGGGQARLAEAVARFELGDLRGARKAAEAAVALLPKETAVQNVYGLVLTDTGSVRDGIAALKVAKSLARSAGRPASEARAGVNLALAYIDLGDSSSASAELSAAEALAAQAGETELGSAVASAKSAVAALAGTDANVGALLGKGQTSAARTKADAALASARGPRQTLVATLDRASVDRADGNLDGAAARLSEAARKAREAGLVREQAIALADLGIVQSLAGRMGPAADTLRAATKAAAGGGYRVVEVDARCELGLVLAHSGDLSGAAAEQAAAGELLAGMQYPQGTARQAELGGVIAAQRGDLGTARTALSRAAAYYSGKGRNLDAARAATSLASVTQQVEPAGGDAAASTAEGYFRAAGDTLGPAHVALARALGDARAKRLPEALAGFARAAKLAEAVGGGRATVLARVARENAAATLVMLGHGQDLAKLAADAGLGDLVQRQAEFSAASGRYDAALAAYGAGRYDEARAAFSDSRKGFEALGEKEYALRARRGAAWAGYNALVTQTAATAQPSWKALVEETTKVEDAELFARAYGASAMVDHTMKLPGLESRLAECSNLAEKAGLFDVSSRCQGALAEIGTDLKVRARHAREALRLDPAGSAGPYALYGVAVDAYNAGDNALAIALATEARPRAGKLLPAVDEVLAAAKAAE